MTWPMAAFTFLNAWWVVLFMVLPWGVRQPKNPAVGVSSGAPEKPGLKKKFIATTLLAALVTAALAVIINSGIVPVK